MRSFNIQRIRVPEGENSENKLRKNIWGDKDKEFSRNGKI